VSPYIFEIGDTKGKSFRIEIKVGGAGDGEGYWRSKDKGYIKINSGKAQKEPVVGTLFERNLLLCDSTDGWGMRLEKYSDLWGGNDHGKGIVLQPWVLGLEPGTISWVIIDS
jgi:hypothetical protein